MGANKFFEVQREGVNGLARWLAKESGARRLSEAQVLKLAGLLAKLLSSQQQEISHSAAVSCSQLVNSCRYSPLELCDLVVPLVTILQAPDSLENRDTKRHAAEGLKAFALNPAFSNSLAPHAKDISLLANCSDTRLRTNITAILSTLS